MPDMIVELVGGPMDGDRARVPEGVSRLSFLRVSHPVFLDSVGTSLVWDDSHDGPEPVVEQIVYARRSPSHPRLFYLVTDRTEEVPLRPIPRSVAWLVLVVGTALALAGFVAVVYGIAALLT